MNMARITQIKYDRQELIDILCTIAEGGVQGWAYVTVVERQDELNYTSIRLTYDDPHAEGQGQTVINTDDVQAAINLLLADEKFNGQCREWITSGDVGQIDGEAADVIAQYAAFREVVYG